MKELPENPKPGASRIVSPVNSFSLVERELRHMILRNAFHLDAWYERSPMKSGSECQPDLFWLVGCTVSEVTR